jgi:hypothetical protein
MSAEPDDFELRIAGSNPFNPTSLVRISVPKANVPVRLTVYDASGKKIKDLFSGKLDRGVHDIVFNGQTLAAGVYTCRMNAGRFVASARLVLTK